MAELDAIGTLNPQSVILIDDARYFVAPPPPPHDAMRKAEMSTNVESTNNRFMTSSSC
jgi:hypothetical protein